ncbi:flagellar biosynthesis protein FlhF [Luteimonas yindakuii]|uniref:flagellar biosynthesis protein FlhF n=1 Tax=Luteimonas yindakuii TaxID=2565782 RepID=UPI0010A3D9E6|nr:flagellar biosynthesis protein FlhF [Luteimonas yindakuii]QCO67674.1 flagellar biosynthesis protein FlhF [Luteimonas yindakuii]
MNIRRFVAADMRTALQMVRDAHGPDAVILSNRRTDEGVEIVAASNYDEACLQRALEAQPRPPAEAPAPAVVAPERPLAPAERWLRELAPATTTAPVTGTSTPAPVAPAPAVAAMAAPATPRATPRRAAAAVAEPTSAARARDAGDEFDGPAFAELLARTRPPVAPVDDRPAPAPEPPAPVLAAVPTPPAPASDGELARMRDELAQMRTMIEREMARLTDERLRGSPVRAQMMDLLEDYGFDAGITRDVVLQIPADTPEHRARGLMLGLISRKLPICPVDPLHEAGVIALVGPTGAGKTTTIAKLAALYAAQYQPRDVALVTTDTARIGGREQLHSYGRQLGIAVHEADSEASLLQLLQKLQDYRLVLVDTAGLSQRDRALAGQLNWLRAARQVRTLLVLPANTHFADLDEVVRRFEHARPQGVVLTKLDETSRLGSALSVVVDHQLPLTWTTDGQRIPEDLSRANAAHLVLRLEDLRRDADKPMASEHSAPEHTHAVA